MPDPNAGAGGNPGAGAGAAPVAITAEALGAVQGDAFRALLPADIQSKPYAKEINTFGDLIKKFDGAQGLLGQRAVPDPNDPPEKWVEFHGKHAPKTIEEYKLADAIEGVPPEYLTKATGLTNMVKSILFAAKASPYQARLAHTELMKVLYKAESGIKKQGDDAFIKLSGDLFGEQRDAVIANGKKFLAAYLPDNIKPLLEGMDEKQLTVVLAATDNLAKKFTGEDPFRGGGNGPGGSGGETKDQLIAQMQAIMKDPAYSDPFKDKPKHSDLNQKMEVIRGKLKKLQAGG